MGTGFAKTIKPVILVVDDELVIRQLLERHLSFLQCKVLTAESGEKALSALQGVRPDLVFMDIRMPGMGGLKCLARLKKLYRDLHVVMLTAVEDMRMTQLALTGGARDYVSKPVDLAVISKIVTTHLIPSDKN